VAVKCQTLAELKEIEVSPFYKFKYFQKRRVLFFVFSGYLLLIQCGRNIR
jgi:hypothetical protein